MKFKKSKFVIRVSALAISLVVLFVSGFSTQATKEVDKLENTTSDLESKLSSLNKELDNILDQIEKTSESLEKTKEELAIAKGLEEAQYESMMLRIKYMYESGNTSLLELVLSSSCWAEFINRAEYVSKITEYDRDMLEELTATREEIAEKEAQLVSDQEYLASLQAKLDKKIASASDELTEYKAKLKKAKEDAEKAAASAKEEIKPIVPETSKETSNNSDSGSGNSSSNTSISATASDVELLAALIECEAGSTNYEALLAVGSVVVNRMKNRYYPDTVRGVIYHTGQFPPAYDGKVDRVLARGVKPLCVQAATDALNGKNNIGDCLYFRAASSGREGLVIGDNVFF